MPALTPNAKQQFFDSNGDPLSGGKLYSYASGTTTPLATYTDYTGLTANTNPIVLDSRGEANVWLGTDAYKLKLTTSTGVEIWTVDGIQGDSSDEILATLALSTGSSLIGFIQSGGGAVATTVQAKSRLIISLKDFAAPTDGTDASSAINNALNEANSRGGGLVMCEQGKTYTIGTGVLFPDNVVLDMNGATFQKMAGAPYFSINVVSNLLASVGGPNEDIGIMNGRIIGTVLESDASSSVDPNGHNILFFGVTRFFVYNMFLDNANGDNMCFRQVDDGLIYKVICETYGRNSISPTSCMNTVFLDVTADASGVSHAAPGECVDMETDSASEFSEVRWIGCRIRGFTIYDPYTAIAGYTALRVIFDGCLFTGQSPRTCRIYSANATTCRNSIIISSSCRITVNTATASGLEINGVSDVICDATFVNETTTGTTRAISITGDCSGLICRSQMNASTLFANGLVAQSAILTGAKFVGVNLGTVYLTGSSNLFDGCTITALTLNSSASIDNVFAVNTTIGSITLATSATVQDQIFGSDRGSRSQAFYSASETVPDGATYDLVIPLPTSAATAAGRTLFIAAGYSHRGDTSHWAQYLGTVRIGTTSTAEANVISQTGAAGKSIAVQAVTTTSVTLRLTYQYTGVFGATIIG